MIKLKPQHFVFIFMCLLINILPIIKANNNRFSIKRRPFYNISILKRPPPLMHDELSYLIHTQGCSIPNYADTMHYQEPKDLKLSCNKRLVFITKTSNDKITFHIDLITIGAKSGMVKCCFRYAIRSDNSGDQDNFLKYSRCKRFEHGDTVTLKYEIVTVTCGLRMKESNYTAIVYKDAFLILKKKPTNKKKHENNKWNVILLGIDTMSRGRAYHSLPNVVNYLKENGWLDYRGYTKVDYDTFPNIMTVLTGEDPLTSAACSHNIEHCKRKIIWEQFKNSSYMTAFGDDSYENKFGPNGFKEPPTDHYARPIFTTKPYKRGNIVCLKRKESVFRLLNYAEQFVEAYKRDNFFGFFWLNNLSHDTFNLPRASEKRLLFFLENLQNVITNTFIFFFSDHGFNFGNNRRYSESYYDSRLPMLFIWVPSEFRRLHEQRYYNLQLNQHRLTTPYNLHATLWEILSMGDQNKEIVLPAGCPKCNSLFKEIPTNSTCSDANIDEAWCPCHRLLKIEKTNIDYTPSLKAAVELVQNTSRQTITKNCTTCSPLTLKKTVRIERFGLVNETVFVIVLLMNPMSLAYEIIVRKKNHEYKAQIALPLTAYNPKSDCVVDTYIHKGFCVCEERQCE